MNAPSDPRDRLPPFLRRYCPDQQTCRLWSAKCRSILYDWLARFFKACARAWLALVRTSRPFVAYVARRWRELDRKWRTWTVCALVAVLLLPLLFVFGGRRTEPTETPSAGGLSLSTDSPLRYSVTDLGTLGGDTSEADGINNLGQVVGQADTGQRRYSAFLWESGKGMRDLAGFVTHRGFVGRANAISDKGYVGGQISTTDGEEHAFLWTPESGMRVLSEPSDMDGESVAVNDQGQVAGMHQYNPSELRRAFLWQSKSGMQDFGGAYCAAEAMNDAGQVVGVYNTPGENSLGHAYVWQADKGMQDLGDLRGGAGSIAWAINRKGQVVGVSHGFDLANDRPLPNHMFVWQAGKAMQDLGVLNRESRPRGINNLGQVVGGPDGESSGNPPFLYSDGKMIDLNTDD